MEGPASSRVIALDGLRGVAAAIVVFSHCMCVMQRTAGAFPIVFRTPLALFLSGPGAVQVFFVLSGFVLTRSLSRTSGRYVNLRFLVRRTFRIYPPYWFAVMFSWLASFFYVLPPPRGGFTPWIAFFAGIHPPLSSLLWFLPWPSGAGDLLPVGWTLSVETLFSLIFPLLVIIAVRTHWLLLIAASGTVLLTNVTRPVGIINSLAFSIGIALYYEQDVLRGFFTRGSAARLAVWLAISLLLLLTPPLFFPLIPMLGVLFFDWPRWTLLTLELGAGGIVAATVGSRAVAQILATRPIAFLGRISYSLYLLHFMVLILATRLLSRPPTALDVALLPIGVFAVTLPLATLAHRLVEMPAIALGSWATRWLGQSRSTDVGGQLNDEVSGVRSPEGGS